MLSLRVVAVNLSDKLVPDVLPNACQSDHNQETRGLHLPEAKVQRRSTQLPDVLHVRCHLALR